MVRNQQSKPTPTPTPSPIKIQSLDEFTGGTGTTGTAGGTQQKTTASVSTPSLGNDFGLTNTPAHAPFASPDSIDNDIYKSLSITTDVGVQAMPPEQLAQLQADLKRGGLTPAGYVPTGTLDKETVSALLELKQNAAASGSSDIQTLGQRINTMAQQELVSGTATGHTGPFSRTETQTQEARDITPLSAEHIANQAYQDALGKDATPEQKKALRAALNAYADAHPTISTTKTHYRADGSAKSSHTSSSGGMDSDAAAQIVQDQTQAAPDYAESQAALTYFPLLMNHLGATVNLAGGQ